MYILYLYYISQSMVKMGNFWGKGPKGRLTDSQSSTLSIASENTLRWFNVRRPKCRVLNSDELWENVDQKIRTCVRKVIRKSHI